MPVNIEGQESDDMVISEMIQQGLTEKEAESLFQKIKNRKPLNLKGAIKELKKRRVTPVPRQE
jgi:hypothetical protein